MELINLSKQKKSNKLTPLSVVLLVVLCLFTLCLFILLFWGLITTFKGKLDWNGAGTTTNHVWFPRTWVNKSTGKLFFVENLETVLKYSSTIIYTKTGPVTVEFGEMVLNSILYSIGCAICQTTVPFVVAYCCAKYDNVVSKILVAIVIATMAIPIVGSDPAAIRLAYNMGLYNHIYGLWLMKTNFLGVYFLVFYASFKAQPRAYHEAAMIDGANDWKIMFKISMPLCIGEYTTVMLINFITFWNDYQTPLLYMPNKPTVSWNTFNFAGSSERAMSFPPVVILAAMIVLVPVLILFLIFQKKLLKNLNVGGIKG